MKNGGLPIKIPEPFELNDTKGYRMRFIDFGTGGVKIELHRPTEQSPYWDRVAAVMLPPEFIDAFLLWMASTTGRSAMVLPMETLAVLKGVIANIKNKKTIPKADLKVMSKAARALENLFTETSLAQRALNR